MSEFYCKIMETEIQWVSPTHSRVKSKDEYGNITYSDPIDYHMCVGYEHCLKCGKNLEKSLVTTITNQTWRRVSNWVFNALHR